MKDYEISVPVMGIAHVSVSAESEADALAQAVDIAGPDDVDEGNVFYGPLNRARVDNVYDEEDE